MHLFLKHHGNREQAFILAELIFCFTDAKSGIFAFLLTSVSPKVSPHSFICHTGQLKDIPTYEICNVLNSKLWIPYSCSCCAADVDMHGIYTQL